MRPRRNPESEELRTLTVEFTVPVPSLLAESAKLAAPPFPLFLDTILFRILGPDDPPIPSRLAKEVIFSTFSYTFLTRSRISDSSLDAIVCTSVGGVGGYTHQLTKKRVKLVEGYAGKLSNFTCSLIGISPCITIDPDPKQEPDHTCATYASRLVKRSPTELV